MTYRLRIESAAARQIEALPRDLRRRVDVRILALAHEPRPVGVQRLDGRLHRVRVGDHRIVDPIHDDHVVVVVVAVSHRKDVDRLLRRMGFS
jgi:mRNA interferase RelE/StbE